MISVLNYGVSNVGSMLNMFKKLGVPAQVISSPSEVACAEKIIMPGVGAFDHGMSALQEKGLVEAIRMRVAVGVPILGVCLGMQLLGTGSEEGAMEGLGFIDACCVRFRSEDDPPLRVPHMGWNELEIKRGTPLTEGLEHPRFYFVHSYHMSCCRREDVVATATYGGEFTALVQRDNVWGVQFHPEKSHRFGMALLNNFARI